MGMIIKKEKGLYLLTVGEETQISSKGVGLFVKKIIDEPELVSSYKLDEIEFQENENGLSQDDIAELRELLNNKIMKDQENFFAEEYQMASC